MSNQRNHPSLELCIHQNYPSSVKERKTFSENQKLRELSTVDCFASNVKSFSAKRKMAYIRNLTVHKGRRSVREGKGEGKTKNIFFKIIATTYSVSTV